MYHNCKCEQRKQAYMIAGIVVVAKCSNNKHSTIACCVFSKEGFTVKLAGNIMWLELLQLTLPIGCYLQRRQKRLWCSHGDYQLVLFWPFVTWICGGLPLWRIISIAWWSFMVNVCGGEWICVVAKNIHRELKWKWNVITYIKLYLLLWEQCGAKT